MARASRGPGRVSKTGDSKRVTAPKGSVGRYVDPLASGRVTKAIDHRAEVSPRWFAPVLIGFMILGVVTIGLNYMKALPGAVSPWYLVVGLGEIFAGFFMATKYR